MSRDIPASTDAVLGGNLEPIGLVELHFGSGTVRLWTGIGELSWNGHIWTGTGTLGRIGLMEETVETRAAGIELELSGVPGEILAIANGEDWQGREARVYYGVLNEAMEFIGQPFQIRRGLMDNMTLEEGQMATISLSIESRDIDLGRNRARRYTAEDQRGEYPGDKGCDAVALLQEKEITWNLS
jgi:hypothetical protein